MHMSRANKDDKKFVTHNVSQTYNNRSEVVVELWSGHIAVKVSNISFEPNIRHRNCGKGST